MYDSRLEAYIISENDVGKYSVDDLNKLSKKVILDFSSTRRLKASTISRITNPNVSIRIRGGYDDKERIEYYTNLNKNNPDVRRGVLGKAGLTYYEDSNIYSINEMVQILTKMEKIESDVHKEWSDSKYTLYIYDKLREEIIYHPKYEKQESYDIRTLRGLISGKSVCAGYAIIFKEFMDRRGISCDYVEGATTLEDAKKGKTSHAWNLVTINDTLLPIDLTWDASSYRMGNFSSFEYFSKLSKFIKSHFPSRFERVQDYSNSLYGLSKSYTDKIARQFQRKKELTQSVFILENADKEKIMVAQLGASSDKNSKFYRYACAKYDKDKGFYDYNLFCAENSLLKVFNYLQHGKIDKSHFIVQGVKEMFSSRNINDSINSGSCYLGKVLKDGTSGFKIEKDSDKVKKFPILSKERQRADGSKFLVLETSDKPRVVEGKLLHYGMVVNFAKDKRLLKQYRVVTENSLLEDDSYAFINDFLSEERLDERASKFGGYLGSYSDDGKISSDKKLENIYKISDSNGFTNEDLIPPGTVENNETIGDISFEKLEEFAKKYTLEYDDNMQYHVVDRKTGVEVTSEKAKTALTFASLWLGCAGVKYRANDEINGLSYAFNEGSQLVYDFLKKRCIEDLENNRKIDFSKINENEMKKASYDSYKYTYEILWKLLRNPASRKIVEDYFLLQTPYFKSNFVNSNVNMRNVVNGNPNAINSELEEMFEEVALQDVDNEIKMK